MKNGKRVVRIPFPKGLSADEARRQRELFPSVSTHSEPRRNGRRTDERRSEQCVPKPPAAPVTPQRPVTLSTPVSPLQLNTPVKPVTPFRNPDLNDEPLRWSPRMFKPEVDRYNFSWSEWDSPSREFIDTSYQTVDSPQDAFAHYPPNLRHRIRDILAMKPSPTSSTRSTDSLMVDSVRYETVEIASDFSSDASIHSTPSDLSSWVHLDDHPWSPSMLEMFIQDEKDRQWFQERGFDERELSSDSDSTHSSESSGSLSFVPFSALHAVSTHSESSDLSSFITFSALHAVSTPSNSPRDSLSSVRNHFQSLRQAPLNPPPPPPASPQQQSSGWKSLAVGFAAGVAVAATVTAGLAYAWFSS
ncbi:hypothetical protein F5B20DRAFT_592614 [Whalleya microplaca]|nr:hypothetical protein F5B20DRAFT_592614 [Whalleya microplaca]